MKKKTLMPKIFVVFIGFVFLASLVVISEHPSKSPSSSPMTTVQPMQTPVHLSMKLNNCIVVYGEDSLNNTEINTIANTFSVLICDSSMSSSTLASLKALNPNIQIFGYCDLISAAPANSYWSTVNGNESWFMHDVNGNRILDSYWGWYLMNISSGWKQFYSSYVNSQLNNSLFNGVFADDCWNQISAVISGLQDASTGIALTASDISSSAISNWHSNMSSFLQYVEGNIISGKKVIVNTDEYLTNDYLTVTDGKMNEGFAIGTDLTDYINAMARDSASGKIFIAERSIEMPITLNSSTLAEIAQNANYCHAASLLGMDSGSCYFGYNVGSIYGFDAGADYMPTTVTNLGSPSGPYYQSQSVYMRNFTNGIVLFNPSDNSYTINLGDKYQLTNGTIVSSITLIPWSGETLTS